MNKSRLIIVLIILLMGINISLFPQSSVEPAPPGVGDAELDETQIPLDIPGEQTQDDITVPGVDIPIWEYLRVIFVLACVIGAIYLVFYFLKKGVKKKLPENDVINVLSSRNIQGSGFLHVVEVGTNLFLVSSGDNKINLISEITDKESLDTIRLKLSAENRPGTREKLNFPDIIMNLFKPVQAGREPPEQKGSTGNKVLTEEYFQNGNVAEKKDMPLDFIKNQRKRLKKL